MAEFYSCLTNYEVDEICHQFQGPAWKKNCQVMWTGVPRAEAQQWADNRGMQTLTTAMGPLIESGEPLCLSRRRKSRSRSMYMKGASALFAYHIAKGEKVTVLCPPPPVRFNPKGWTNYQAIEEPILKGTIGGSAVSCIRMVHPTVKGAEDFSYEVWPTDETHLWVAKFGKLPSKQPHWRMVSSTRQGLAVGQISYLIQPRPSTLVDISKCEVAPGTEMQRNQNRGKSKEGKRMDRKKKREERKERKRTKRTKKKKKKKKQKQKKNEEKKEKNVENVQREKQRGQGIKQRETTKVRRMMEEETTITDISWSRFRPFMLARWLVDVSKLWI